MTWLYFVKERRLTNLIWCYSPNGPFTAESYLARYPGDEFVDMMAADFYEFIGPEGLEESGARYAGVIKDMLTNLEQADKAEEEWSEW
jgi:beta-mannanase